MKTIELKTFSLPSEHRFEASGVARIGGSGRFLVVNDKGKRDPMDRLAVAVMEGDTLVVRDRLSPEVSIKGHAEWVPARGFEDATGSKLNAGIVFAVTSFGGSDDPAKRNLLRIAFDVDGTPDVVEKVAIADPEAAEVGFGYVNVEGLALSPDERRLFLGARCWGPSKEERGFGVALFEYDMEHPSEAPMRPVMVHLDAVVGRSEGLAAVEYVPELGGYLLITSYENKETGELGGHLWHTPDLDLLADVDTWLGLPRLPLPDKPEGVCLDGERRILVVFDRDTKRKAAAGLAQNQSVYALIEPAELFSTV